jgi:hypothetical protein
MNYEDVKYVSLDQGRTDTEPGFCDQQVAKIMNFLTSATNHLLKEDKTSRSW